MASQVADVHLGKAILKNFNQSPRKARLVVDMVRGKRISTALSILGNCDRKTAAVLEKLLLSAVANAQNKHDDIDVDDLYIKSAWVNEGLRLGRSMPRARGTASPIIKRRSTITVLVDEK